MGKMTYDDDKHQYKLDGLILPSVTQIIQESGLINLEWVDRDLLEAKADLGRKVHSATELNDTNNLNTKDLHPTLKLYLDSWIKFRTDYKFVLTEIELKLFHKLYRYAGRIDRVGLLNKKLILVDIKSGTEQKTSAIQTAGYELLYNQDKKKGDQIKERMIVYLNPEGYKVIPNNNPNDKSVFLACLTITNYLRSIK